ncbi:MAG: radical SAM protein [Chitinivibrionales bacterium]|nr:radical SAM protein [Chitinivibrionales bacterium]MBD3397304.1 radical SAM protein [Chitinivibrionales bacterium]
MRATTIQPPLREKRARRMYGGPSYTHLSRTDWDARVRLADEHARACALCPRRCGVNRLKGETGFCGAGARPRVSSIFAHHGEEPPLSGTGGSGTVFFSCCTLQCVFCQNYQISHERHGEAYPAADLARHMLRLQEGGCHNVNLVTPAHFIPWILRAIRTAAREGLQLPIVYNCGGYELVQTLALLEGIVDIYLPDMKYGDNDAASRYSGAADYVEVNRAAITEMFRQAGPLKTDKRGVAERGLIIRHLVLPNGEAGSRHIRDFLKAHFDPEDISMSVMAQYRPLYRAAGHERISRPVHPAEYQAVRDAFVRDGFGGFYQEIDRLNGAFVINFEHQKHGSLNGE